MKSAPMKATRIILHCSASKNNQRWDIKDIEKEHIKRGFSRIGYHIIIQPDGEVQLGRPLNEMGAHCEGENSDSIGICLIGNDKFTDAQFRALRYQLDGLFQTTQLMPWRIYCHHQFSSAMKQGKTCPNIEPQQILSWYLVFNNKAIEDKIFKVK
jgi:hypothetical protein